MRVYFAGYASYLATPEIGLQDGDFGLLVAYLEVKNKKDLSFPKPVLLDSSAFSVSTGRAKIDVKEYGEYLLKNKDLYNIYANLDVIGDAEETQKNQDYLESLGLNPLPTFHFGSDYKVFEELIEKYDYIGLGGLVPLVRRKDVLFAHLDKCFSIIMKKKPKLKTHGWGMTGQDVVMRYPFYSVDSTTWLVGGKFNRVDDFNVIRLKPHKGIIKYTDYKKKDIYNAKQILKMIETATKIWEKRGIKWD